MALAWNEPQWGTPNAERRLAINNVYLNEPNARGIQKSLHWLYHSMSECFGWLAVYNRHLQEERMLA